MKSKFLQEFKSRGFFHQCTDEEGLDNLFFQNEPSQNGSGVSVYIGFDCTAPCLHVGSLMQIMVLKMLQKHGHKPIILLGGATTKIGDPSGKDESRPKISSDVILQNMAGIEKIFKQFGLNDIKIVNNADWENDFRMNLIEISEHFSINRMLTFDSVKLRLEREGHLSLKEFLYMVLQAYDFVHLAKGQLNCMVQIGGSDQWGNIVNGVELYRRMTIDNKDSSSSLFGLTTPLITTASGAKMGKTASGAIWLGRDKLPAYDYWQFWRNSADEDVWKFMLLFTELELDHITSLEKEMTGSKINEAKKILANEATKLCHGEDAAILAQETAKKVFEQGDIGDSLPIFTLNKSELENGISIIKLLQIAQLVKSNGEAKRLIKGGGAKLNNVKIEDEAKSINIIDFASDDSIKISAGKKKHAVVKIA